MIVGVLTVIRTEPRAFSQKHIELLETFADQAVIAIENTRLFEEVQARTQELQESLEQQTATGDILRVIAGTPDDAQPVFDAIAQSALRLFAVSHVAIMLREGDFIRSKATAGTVDPRGDFLIPLDRNSASGRSILDRTLISINDTEAVDAPTFARESGRMVGFRAIAAAPMLRESSAIGSVHMMRTTPGPFTTTQIELLKTFADQAVIAIENTRLFETERARTRELQEALEQQAATSKILSVISGSPGKLEPVFDTILRSARQLCAAEYGHLLLFNGETWRAAALHNVPKPYADWWNRAPVIAGPETNVGRVQRTGRPDQVADVRIGKGYTAGTPLGIATVELAGARTLLSVPLLKEGAVIGSITLYRTEVRPFDEGQIELLSSFADQAVIAIENTRLFDEVQTRTRELARSVEELKALAGVGQAVSSSLELKVVLPRILEHACALSDTGGGAIYVFDKARGQFGLEAGLNMSEDLIAAVREHPIRVGESSGRTVCRAARSRPNRGSVQSSAAPALRNAYEGGRMRLARGSAAAPG